MCKTRIKIISMYANSDSIEESVNLFISNPKNKVAKVNSIEIKFYHDYLDSPCMFAVINYELED